MPFDPYDWTKNKIEDLVNKIAIIRNDGEPVSPGQIWSIKKLLVLDYYIGGSVNIFRKYFENWFYVDTHCGSGLIGLKETDLTDERFPGSPLIAALRNLNSPFTNYFLSDNDQSSISKLNQRLSKLKPSVGTVSYNPVVRDFEDTVDFVETKNEFGNAFLIFIDPNGFAEIKWELMERLLRIKTADIFLTFMTPYIALNRTNALPGTSYEETFNDLYGNNFWFTQHSEQELLDLYVSQIRRLKKHVYTISVLRQDNSRLYDIIIATNSWGAGNIIDDAKKIMDITTTQMMSSALKVITKKTTEISDFF